jgi:hypothetical protein
MQQRLTLEIALALVASATRNVYGAEDECREAVDHFKSTVDDVSDGLKHYANCVSRSC